MKLPLYATLLGASILVMGCSDAGSHAAHRWLESAASGGRTSASLPSLPDIVDTPPVNYDPAGFADPFSARPASVYVRATSDALVDNPRARFPGTDLDALQLIGLLKNDDVTVALVSNGQRYENIRVGDVLGREQAEVTAVSSQGVLARLSDGRNTLLKFTKRSS